MALSGEGRDTLLNAACVPGKGVLCQHQRLPQVVAGMFGASSEIVCSNHSSEQLPLFFGGVSHGVLMCHGMPRGGGGGPDN